MDTSREGYCVEDEEDGTEGFLEADDDTFWAYDDEELHMVAEARSQGRKMKTRDSRAAEKEKAKVGKGSAGRRFLKKRERQVKPCRRSADRCLAERRTDNRPLVRPVLRWH